MIIINGTVTGQRLALDRTVVATGITIGQLKLSFSPEWDGYVKVAVFFKDKDKPYRTLFNDNGVANIPSEVANETGTCFIGVFGTLDNKVITTEAIGYNFRMGAITKDLLVPDPTPDIYTQLLSAYNTLGGAITDERLKAAVDLYIDEHPNSTKGATDEQAAQISQNTSDISQLKEDSSQLSEDIVELKDKTKDFVSATSNNEDRLFVIDGQGNVIAQIDSDGVHSTDFLTPDGSVTDYNNLKNKPEITGGNPDVISEYDDALYITDGQGYIIFKADKNGVSGLNMSSPSSGAESPYKGMKLITIGDSLSAHDKWQKWLVEWLGVTFDNDENINGKDGHAPMAKGGTAIMPTDNDSIYLRSLDAHYYNPDIIIVYAGQNDVPHFGNSEGITEANFGTVNDLPYLKDVPYTEVPQEEWTDYTSFYEGRPTMYSRSMGLIQRLCESCPSAIIKILTPMQMWTSDNSQSVGRFALVDMWKQIGKKYGIGVIDLWNESGVCSYNGSVYYPNTGNVHPTDNGYKIGIALSIYQKL